MIEYVEVRSGETREIIGIIDTAQSVIWQSSYYSVGTFEIYAMATPDNLSLLIEDNYITRPDNDECGIIERVEITDNSSEGKMIAASGRFIKSILDRRVIFSASITGAGTNYVWNCSGSVLSGNVETAVRKLIYDNAVNATGSRPETGSYRNIDEIYWTNDDVSGITDVIVTTDDSGTEQNAEKQVTYKVLLDYTDGVLQEYECGAKMWLDLDRLKFRYKVFKGIDRSIEQSTNDPVIFSTEFDNLVSSTYTSDNSTVKNTALIGGEGEGTDRKCAFYFTWGDELRHIKGIGRRETFVDASSISTTYKDGDEEKTYTNDVYRKMLEAQGRQSIAELQRIETFDGEIDTTNSSFTYGEDYNLGDLVTIEDRDIGKYINARILSVTEVQDDNGYNIDIEYGS